MPRYKFQKNDFNPLLIISNIIILSCAYYIINTFFTIFFNSFFKTNLHINQILTDEALDFSSYYGYSYLCSYFFTCILMIFVFVFVIDKAKKILDFVLTTFFIHLILCTINNGFPSRILWWLIQGLGITLITLVAEYLSLSIEQREIKINCHISTGKKIKI